MVDEIIRNRQALLVPNVLVILFVLVRISQILLPALFYFFFVKFVLEPNLFAIDSFFTRSFVIDTVRVTKWKIKKIHF